MEVVNIHRAKTNLSSLIERTLKGEKVVIARKGKPLVTLSKVKKRKMDRVHGNSKEKFGWLLILMNLFYELFVNYKIQLIKP